MVVLVKATTTPEYEAAIHMNKGNQLYKFLRNSMQPVKVRKLINKSSSFLLLNKLICTLRYCIAESISDYSDSEEGPATIEDP